MPRAAGYLANLTSLPPLIFRFQFNPESLQERKSYDYQAAEWGRWEFDQTAAASGIKKLTALYDDIKEFGPYFTGADPLHAGKGGARTFSLDFALDAENPGPRDGSQHYGGSIEPDLAVLRAFMNPGQDIVDIITGFAAGRSLTCAWTNRPPPTCSLTYGGISLECVMTDLDIKIVKFADDGRPLRAEVRVGLKQQTKSISAVVELVTRTVNVVRSYDREGFGKDLLEVSPIGGLFE